MQKDYKVILQEMSMLNNQVHFDENSFIQDIIQNNTSNSVRDSQRLKQQTSNSNSQR